MFIGVTVYGDDVAYVHAQGYSDPAVAAADRLIEELGRPADAGGLVVEIGCGPGVSAERLIHAGFSVVGSDVSSAMISLAKARVPRGTFTQESWVSLEIPPSDAVLAANEVLNYTDAPGTTIKALERLFARVFKALWPGGIFLFDMAGPGRVPGKQPETHTQVGEDWAVVSTSTEDPKKSTLTRQITVMRKVGPGIRTTEETHTQRLIASSKVLEMLRKAGFKARPLQGYGGERAFPGHSVFVARRP
jgi:SAM-dependent methyltransferase